MIELRDAGFLHERTRDASARTEAWKRIIGQRPVAARLETLPENKIRRSAFALSSTVQLILAAVVIALPLFFPEHLSIKMVYQVTPVAAPDIEAPTPQADKPEPPKKTAPIPVPAPEPVRMAKLFAPQPLVAPKPRIVQQRQAWERCKSGLV